MTIMNKDSETFDEEFLEFTSAFYVDKDLSAEEREELKQHWKGIAQNLLLQNETGAIEKLFKLLVFDLVEQYYTSVIDFVCETFKEIGEPALEFLLEKLEPYLEPYNDEAYSDAAAYAIRQIGDKRTFESLVEVLEKSKGVVYSQAVQALSCLVDKRATKILFDILLEERQFEDVYEQTKFVDSKFFAAQGLIKLNEIQLLKEILPTSSYLVTLAIITNLGVSKNREMVVILEELFSNPKFEEYKGVIKSSIGINKAIQRGE
jgi:HEAT repeat protein